MIKGNWLVLVFYKFLPILFTLILLYEVHQDSRAYGVFAQYQFYGLMIFLSICQMILLKFIRNWSVSEEEFLYNGNKIKWESASSIRDFTFFRIVLVTFTYKNRRGRKIFPCEAIPLKILNTDLTNDRIIALIQKVKDRYSL